MLVFQVSTRDPDRFFYAVRPFNFVPRLIGMNIAQAYDMCIWYQEYGMIKKGEPICLETRTGAFRPNRA